MKKLITLTILLSACCSTQIPSTPEPVPIPEEERKEMRQKSDEKRAWQYAEDEELISALENSNYSKWTIGVSGNLVLADLHTLEIYLRTMKIVFRITIFDDGTLFIDSEKKSVDEKHKARLITLFLKIKGNKNE